VLSREVKVSRYRISVSVQSVNVKGSTALLNQTANSGLKMLRIQHRREMLYAGGSVINRGGGT
jgi:hypothetical protein